MWPFSLCRVQLVRKLETHGDDMPPDPDNPASHRISPWRIGFVCCTLLALLWATQLYLYYAYFGPTPMPWLQAIGWGMSDWYLWGAFTVLIAELARRVPLGRGRGVLSLGIHVLCAALISGTYCTITATAWWAFRPEGPTAMSWPATFAFGLIRWLPWNLVTYVAILGIVHAFEYHRVYRDRELRASQLETQLTQAQLAALKAQLHPHFLFNTLNAISALIHKDPDAAERMVARLSELLRHVLDGGAANEVPLENELSFLQKYLEIERVRFGDRLNVQFGVGPDTLGAAVPSLILQPLVENAIRHGLAPYATSCTIEVNARRIDGALSLEVVDSGPGILNADPSSLREGVGLANTRARLQQLHGNRYQFELRRSAAGGLSAHIEIPFSETLDGGEELQPSGPDPCSDHRR
jgi:signal transduction histidine kinase